MESLLTNELLNSNIVIAFITAVATILSLLVRYLWRKRKPKIKIEARCGFRDGDVGLFLKLYNYSHKKINVGNVGYDPFGGANPNSCCVFASKFVLEPKSCYEEFIVDKHIDSENMVRATILFMTDQLNNVWYAPKDEVKNLNQYQEFKKRHEAEYI